MIKELSDDQFHRLIETIMQHPHSEELQLLLEQQLEDDTYMVMQ